jgi:UDP-glucuronate 4-epimerase
MRVLITGEAGFIGFHLALRLLAEGAVVHGIDGMTDYYDPTLKRARLNILERSSNFSHETLMIEREDKFLSAAETFAPHVIVHLAAQAGVRYSLEHPHSYLQSNVLGSHSVLRAACELKVDHLLLASTSSAYGGSSKLPFSERDPIAAPLSIYAATKVAMESMAHANAHLNSIPTTCFRFFTVYGPWGRPDMALFKFVDAIESGLPIDIYGYGQMRRDFTYVDDLVEAIWLLMAKPPRKGESVGSRDSLSEVAPFRVVNIGGGKPTGLLEFVQAVEHATGRTAERNLLPIQAGDVIETHADTSLLRELVGDFERTDVDEGVARFVEWYRSYKGT